MAGFRLAAVALRVVFCLLNSNSQVNDRFQADSGTVSGLELTSIEFSFRPKAAQDTIQKKA
jgi:hypothetical protein